MTQKHEFIKKLYKEWDTIWLDNEKDKIGKIVYEYQKQLEISMRIKDKGKQEIDEIKKVLNYEEKNLKFIKRIRNMLYKKLEE